MDGDRYPLVITEVSTLRQYYGWVMFVVSVLCQLCVQVASCEQVFISEGHRGLVHSLCWAPDSALLATASADGLAK